jgi:hypothetical protein
VALESDDGDDFLEVVRELPNRALRRWNVLLQKTLATIGAPRAWQRGTGRSDGAKVCCRLAVSVA